MKASTRQQLQEIFSWYNDESPLYGREASIETGADAGTVMIRLWRNKNLWPAIFRVPIQQFLNMAGQTRQLPYWQHVVNFGSFVAPGCCKKWRVQYED